MSEMKSLAKDTAIYGLSSIIGKFLNYLLVPLYTYVLARTDDYGIVTNLYAWTALLLVLLTYGMETGFFRFANREEYDAKSVYKTAYWMLFTTSAVFSLLVLIFQQPLATALGYADHAEFVAMMFVTVAIDAFACIPFAYLRYAHRPVKFASLKILNIVLNIVLNLLYLIVLPALRLNPLGIYDENFHLEVVWVFYINMFCSAATLLMLWKEVRGFRFGFDWGACKRMLTYTWPLMVMGVVGQFNQAASSILFPYFYDGSTEEARHQLGIYGACIKIAMIMVMITQAFRYAYEPFVFGKAKDRDNKQTYAVAMKYYIIFTLLAFLAVVGYMDLLRYLVGESYWEGLRVVPIVMAAEIMFGVFFNLSFWYKLTNRTVWGAYFSGIGAVVLVLIDVLLIPRYSYMACAWAGFFAYAVSMVVSYWSGQKYFPVKYPLKDILFYTVVALLLFFGMTAVNKLMPVWAALLVNTVLIFVFMAIIVKRDFPLRNLPIVGKYFK